ncbi:helix-turn-helix transcriptional regulator [Chromobacterium vaccinii]|uniref:helix-turn-helix transcriptional regulator n=1 Tax=Chromobacterium TaxID=535 RepID=UPI00130516F2|nr:AraC family transcriptional regulator [Chromobacterium sp. ATCC 53434]
MNEFNSGDFFALAPPAPRPHGIRVQTIRLSDGLTVSRAQFDRRQELLASTEGDDGCIHFNCLLRGSIQVRHEGGCMQLDCDKTLSSYAPGKRFLLGCSEDCCNIELRITPQLLAELTQSDPDSLGFDDRLEGCLLQRRCSLQTRVAAQRLARLLEQGVDRLLLHSAALEFLAWQVRSLQAAAAPAEAMPSRERRQLQEARERLLSDLSQPPTIEQLSRATGLNQCKLKQGFKTLFGSSVYALFQKERMAKALKLLQELSVTETASRLGYSNISHFSSAFRKEFGLLPSEARRAEPS